MPYFPPHPTLPSTFSMPDTTPSPPSVKVVDTSAELSDVEKIKALHAARRSRRSRPIVPPVSSEVSADPSPPEDDQDDSPIAALKRAHAAEMETLRCEAADLRIEMGSLRRNHLQNIKQLTSSRDMFASQLAREQALASRPAKDSKRVDDMAVQLRAARSRNADLESENESLRDDLKQLNFRMQASKTLEAATDGYEKIVDDLVEVKLKCAQLQEEKEDLLRINKEAMSTSAVLREANGELEKSRSQWVLQCADVESQRAKLEAMLKEYKANNSIVSADASDLNSDLHHVKL